MNIDVHCHLVPEDCKDLHANGPDGREYGVRFALDANGKEVAFADGRPNAACQAEDLWSVERRLRDMDAAGVDVQAVSAPPFLFLYPLEAGQAAAMHRRLNESFAAVVRAHPDRFIALAAVPLQDTDRAIAELDHAVNRLGMRGVEICSNVNGENLDSLRLFPFFERVEQLGVPIFIHPSNVAAGDRLREYYLSNLLGNPTDTTIAAASLVFGGVLKRLPALNVYLAHGGGATPYICGRWQHGWEVRPEPKRLLDRAPMEYVRRFYFDTITHSSESLAFLVKTFGSDRVMVGTDYPFDMGDSRPLDTVRVLGLDDEQNKSLQGGNAVRLFKLDLSRQSRE